MKNNKKGFTLVELLAVIVILAVVILIAVTAVIPRMNDARKGAFADEAMAYIRGAQEAYVESQMGESEVSTCYTVAWLNANKIDKKDSTYEGYVTLDANGKGTAYITNNKYMINGGTGSLSKTNVVAAGTLETQPSTCVDAE